MSVTVVEAPSGPRNGHARAPSPRVARDREGLLGALDRIDSEGWDSRAGIELLQYVRNTVVRPNVAASGLSGPAAEQAEATAWAATWEALTRPALRSARSPWGVLWAAARRAAMGEVVSAAYLTDVDTGWRLTREQKRGGPPNRRPVRSLSELEDRGFDLVEDGNPIGSAVGPLMRIVLDEMIAAGWEAATAAQLVEAIAAGARRNARASWEVCGWRVLAEAFDLPPWRVRRVMVAMLGTPDWPGLVERMAVGGKTALDPAEVRAAIRPTIARWTRVPATAKRTQWGTRRPGSPAAA